MAILKLEYQQDDYESLQEGELSAKEFLNEVLFSGSYEDISPEDEVIDILLGYHGSDGTIPEISDLELEEAEYEEDDETGKARLSYLLAYSSACAGSNSEELISELVNFKIDQESSKVVFTFIDLNTRSTVDEF
ncbi:hypothetical protein DBR11_13510 [Pedobacter sp. HMWF019]|uniref:hypothetical protein n=1 Tax=Pedobacter sp. HMWF019 TaxID=2056856 RepID=UPI000D37C33D|nr:hypothetical protein [Pedobacter sp. HMWF019]PTS99024.1 hypothetical protein DBR11_13510 [Pedobacter sp. HMWF019]